MRAYTIKEIVIDTMHSLGLTIPRLILIMGVVFWVGYWRGV